MGARSDRVVALLPERELDLLLVTGLVNVRYLTGYTGTNGLALVGPERRGFLTDFRYVEQAAEEVDGGFTRGQVVQDLLDALPQELGDGPLRVGFDDAAMSVRAHTRLRDRLPPGVELIPAGGLVEGLRAVKDPVEVERIRAAAALADRALERLLSEGLVGRTEREAARALEIAMVELGASGPSFETIVACGPHGALPHANPRDVQIEPDRLVVIDWGAELGGYCSDCTRTVATGQVDDQAAEAYALVRASQLAGLEAVQAGRRGQQVDRIAREVIETGGLGERFGHGLGHGVGLEVHEAPRLSRLSEDTLEAGNVVTVEPGVYLPGAFGVRIEDLVVVTETGCEILSSLPKELRVVQ